jgi:hypothetical protein
MDVCCRGASGGLEGRTREGGEFINGKPWVIIRAGRMDEGV